jgi:hypothetical protein
MGDNSLYRELLQKAGSSAQNLEKFKEKFAPFFVEASCALLSRFVASSLPIPLGVSSSPVAEKCTLLGLPLDGA